MNNNVEKKSEKKPAKKIMPTISFDSGKIASYAAAALIIYFLLVFLLPKPSYKTGFCTLTDLQTYATTVDEWIKMENDSILFPSYENYYKQHFTPTFWSRWVAKRDGLFCRLKLKKQPLFSPSFFKNILEEVTAYRTKHGWVGDIVQKFEVQPTSKIVVFGVIQGAFHSLVRYLAELKRLEIIDENFKLLRSDYYLLFLGNVVNRSPYTLETLSVVLRLMQQNPQNVIYMRGTNEFYDYWKDHTLRRELELRCAGVSSSKIPLVTEVNRFFDTLPITTYATMPSWSSPEECNYFKLHAYIDSPKLLKLLNENNYASFLMEPNAELATLHVKHLEQKKQIDSNKLKLKAIVHDMQIREGYEENEGLLVLPPTKGIITWTIISANTEVYRKALNFAFYSFVLLEKAEQTNSWRISLNYKKITEKTSIPFKNKKFDLFSGYNI